jgi:hypothetical protein
MNYHAVPNATMGYPGRPQNGGSNPRFYDFDDGVTRLVKWHPSRHGAKASYNELVASRLGQLVGAPILRGAVVYVPDEIIPDDHRADGAVAGFHFGVARMEGENFVPTMHYAEIENAAELPAAAVFLAWLAVGDQEGHNQYLQRLEVRQQAGPAKATKRFRLIDMGQMFGSFAWDAHNVLPVHDAYALPSHLRERTTWAKLEPAMDELRAVADEAIQNCFIDYPTVWDVTEESSTRAHRTTTRATGRTSEYASPAATSDGRSSGST